MRILLLEDDLGLGRAVQEHLAMAGHQVSWAITIAQAEDELSLANPELLLLDLRLPDGSGLDLLHAVRARGDQRPAIILTARDQVSDRIAGLNAGADDYLVKPFDLKELNARVQAVARRYAGAQRVLCNAGELELDLTGCVALVKGKEAVLTAREWGLVALLARRPGTVLPRERLEEELSGIGGEFESNAVEVYISRVRRKLGHEAIETLRGIGYRLRP